MKRLLKKCRVLLIFYIFLNCVNYAYAQVSVQQFWLLNQSPNALVWDNTGWNNQIDNGSGTFSTSSLQWTGNGGKTNTKWNACKNAMFGGNLGVGTAGIVTLGTPITNMKSISFRPATSGNFTIIGQSITTACANDLPINVDSGLSPTIQSVLTGSNSITKTGTGSLILAGTNTYTGTTNVKEGTLQIGAGTAAGTIAGSVPVNVSSGATFFWNNPANMTFSNKLSGTGTARFQGNSSSSAKRVSQFYLTGDNTGFSGNIKIHTASFWAVNLQSQFGSATITIEKGACARLQTVEFNNSFILEDQSGYWDTNPTINVAGALWFSSGASLSGNLILNNTTNVIMGDATAQNSALLNWDGGNTTISGVISGPGNLAMSCNSGGWTNGGVPPPSNISLTGTLSNTYLGTTVVNGQQRTASLLLRKTGGAVAIPANGTVWMGNNTGGNSLNQPGFGAEANLRMGDDQSTGSTTGVARNQWDNQFGSGVVMQFNNTGGNYMRFDLQGTNQTLAGLNAGSTATPAAAIIQNQNYNAFNPQNPATLTLTGSDNYLYNGHIRDQENNGTTNKLNIIWNGTGSQTIVGNNVSYTGTTTVNSGSLICYNTTAFKSDTTINAPGILEMNVPSGTISSAYTISGSGSLIKTGTGTQILMGNNTISGTTAISGGTLQIGNNTTNGTLGTSPIIDNASLGIYRSDDITFPNLISGTGNVIKDGTNTVIMTTDNTYSGTTTINNGVLQIGNGGSTGSLGTGNIIDNGGLTFFKNSSIILSNQISGTGNLISNISGSQLSFGTPTSTSERTDGPWMVGNVFTTSMPLILSELGIWAGGATSGTLGKSSQVGIWNAAGTLLVTVVIPAGNPVSSDGFSYVPITPITLVSGANYTIGGQAGSGYNAFLDAYPNPAFTPTTNLGITVQKNVYNSGSTFSRPVTVGTASPLRYFPVSFLTQTPTLTLNSASTYTGGTIINSGTVSIYNVNALGTGSVTINTGGVLQLNGLTITNTIINNGGIVIP